MIREMNPTRNIVSARYATQLVNKVKSLLTVSKKITSGASFL